MTDPHKIQCKHENQALSQEKCPKRSELENKSDEAEIQNYINRIPLLRKKLRFSYTLQAFHHQNPGFTDGILPFINMKFYAI